MASVTTSIHVLENSTSAASATVLAPSTSADADIPEGDCDCDGNQLDALGVCGGDCAADEDADGICDNVDPCVGELDECGICNGPGAIYECGCSDIPEGDCDCDGNQLDALGVCGGDCAADEDADGICDNVDPCVGELDECGICNGPGAIYECGCADIPEGDCDCDGNQLDALGVCGGDCEADEDADGICDDVDPLCWRTRRVRHLQRPGAPSTSADVLTFPKAIATVTATSLTPSASVAVTARPTKMPMAFVTTSIHVLENSTSAASATAAWRHLRVRMCGHPRRRLRHATATSLTPSASVAVTARPTKMPMAFVTTSMTALENSTSAASATALAPSTSADVRTSQKAIATATATSLTPSASVAVTARPTKMPMASVTTSIDCVGELDECGICNGPGAIYECGCADIPEGDCDCDGNQLDALGVCGGDCAADEDADGICDNVDPCVGELDECGICNGPGAIYECGCADIPEGDCDCDGNQLDALGVCGGDCAADEDADGICDDVDPLRWRTRRVRHLQRPWRHLRVRMC